MNYQFLGEVNKVKEKIISELKRIEHEEQVKILFAVESGSRA